MGLRAGSVRARPRNSEPSIRSTTQIRQFVGRAARLDAEKPLCWSKQIRKVPEAHPGRRTGLIDDIDADLHLLKVHLPYHESDHLLNIAFNALAGGERIEHLELRRNDEVYLNALGAERIPDPTTAGDFCRRFCGVDVMTLMDSINKARQRVWAQQPPEFLERAILDADGTLIPSDAECTQGMDFAYDGQYGYHPLLISLFYMTNDREMTAEELVFSANEHCNQENLIAQLKGGVRALTAPVDDLVSNWAYIVMASLAWSLKAWSAFWFRFRPAPGETQRGETKAFEDGIRDVLRGIHPDAMSNRAGRTALIYRLLSWNPWQGVFLRLVERLHECRLC